MAMGVEADPEGKKSGRGDSTTGDKERTAGSKQGGPMNKRPSDPGGQGQGSPVAGGKRSGPFNESQKSIGHTRDYWIRKIVKNSNISESEANVMVSSWVSEYKKSGTIYFPTTTEDDDKSDGLVETVRRKKAIGKVEYIVRKEGLPEEPESDEET